MVLLSSRSFAVILKERLCEPPPVLFQVLIGVPHSSDVNVEVLVICSDFTVVPVHVNRPFLVFGIVDFRNLDPGAICLREEENDSEGVDVVGARIGARADLEFDSSMRACCIQVVKIRLHTYVYSLLLCGQRLPSLYTTCLVGLSISILTVVVSNTPQTAS